MKDKKGFILYADQIDVFNALNNEQAGKLIKHVLAYVNDENPETEDPIIKIAFIPIKQQLKRDLVKWESRAEKSRANGKLGGRPPKPKKPSGFINNLTEPKKPVTDNVTVTVNVNDNVNVIDNNTYIEIQRIYNEVCYNLPSIKKLSETRKKRIQGFLKTSTLNDLGDLFKKVQASDFLSGRSGDWKASFDWILKPANVLKIQEGNYDNKESGKQLKKEADQMAFDNEFKKALQQLNVK